MPDELTKRVHDLEIVVQMLRSAIQPEEPGMYHLSRVMLRLGFEASDWRKYHLFLGEIVDAPTEQIFGLFKKHFPRLDAKDLLKIGMAAFQDMESPASVKLIAGALAAGIPE